MSVGSIGFRRNTSKPATRASRTPKAFREERHRDRRDVATRRAGSHPSDELEPVLAGQPEVAHDDVDVSGTQELAGLRGGAGGEHESAEGLEGGDERAGRSRVLMNPFASQCSSAGSRHSARSQGVPASEGEADENGSAEGRAARLATERREAQWSSEDSGAGGGETATYARGA